LLGVVAASSSPLAGAAEQLKTAGAKLVASAIQSVGGGGRAYNTARDAAMDEERKRTAIIERGITDIKTSVDKVLKGGLIKVVPVLGNT